MDLIKTWIKIPRGQKLQWLFSISNESSFNFCFSFLKGFTLPWRSCCLLGFFAKLNLTVWTLKVIHNLEFKASQLYFKQSYLFDLKQGRGYVSYFQNMQSIIFFTANLLWLHGWFLGFHFLCWILGVVPFNMWLISSWEENKYCYKLSKMTPIFTQNDNLNTSRPDYEWNKCYSVHLLCL